MTLVNVNNPMNKTFNGLMNEFFNELPSGYKNTNRDDAFGFPPVNILEKTDSYQLEVAAPGFDKADFNIQLEGNLLTVSSTKKEEAKNEGEKIIKKQFSNKAFKRSFNIDEKIEAATIGAKYENGILTLTLPKKEEVKASTKEITVQ